MATPPILVAHRAGNSVATVRRDVGRADAIEFDVHVFRGRVEVRHEKVLRPTSRLWERWYLLPAGTRVPALVDVLAAVDDDSLLLLDLKCFTRRAARRIRSQVPAGRPVIVAARTWWVLGAFASRPDTRRLRSCRSRRQLAVARRLPGLGRRVGLVMHDRLLDPEVVQDLSRRTPELFTWAITDPIRARQLVDAGLRGLIVDDLDLDWPRSSAGDR